MFDFGEEEPDKQLDSEVKKSQSIVLPTMANDAAVHVEKRSSPQKGLGISDADIDEDAIEKQMKELRRQQEKLEEQKRQLALKKRQSSNVSGDNRVSDEFLNSFSDLAVNEKKNSEPLKSDFDFDSFFDNATGTKPSTDDKDDGDDEFTFDFDADFLDEKIDSQTDKERDLDEFWSLKEDRERKDLEFAKEAQEIEEKMLQEKLRQENFDLEMARKLQTEEFSRDSTPYASYTYNDTASESIHLPRRKSSVRDELDAPSSYENERYHGGAFPGLEEARKDVFGKHETRIVLTSREIREMAQSEIGKDNVKIMAGFAVIKFGREGRPHQRKMWINSSLTHLAWESGQYDGSHRGLDLSQVRSIEVGEYTRNISRSTRDERKVKNLCFSLMTTQRTLDLQACSIIQRDTLVAALRKVVEFNHKYRPVRKDRSRTEVSIFTD